MARPSAPHAAPRVISAAERKERLRCRIRAACTGSTDGVELRRIRVAGIVHITPCCAACVGRVVLA